MFNKKTICNCILGIQALLLSHCSSRRKSSVSQSEKVQNKLPDPDRIGVATPDRLVPLAFGADGFPKMKKFFRENNTSVPQRIEVDFNADGRVDFVQYLNSEGKWVEREAADIDGDGRMDVTSHFRKTASQPQPQLYLQEFDTRYDGRINLWKFYEEGELIRREIDRRGKGRPDYWEFYEKRRLVRVDKDENADGSPDSRTPFEKIIKTRGQEPDSKP